jgi:transposase
MKKNNDPILFKGAITLEITPNDPQLWKLCMLLEAAMSMDTTIEQISAKYGYRREYFYQVLDKFKTDGSQGLQDKPTGPKTKSKRTPEVTKQVIRHRYLDPDASCEVIAQKMTQSGFPISQRSVERVVQDFGLQKRGSIKQARQMSKKT